jgi:hypothetical protein
MAFPGSTLRRISLNASLIVVSLAATLSLIELGLRATSSPLLESRYVYWQLVSIESLVFHQDTSRPTQQPPNSFDEVRGWTDFSIHRGPNDFVIEDIGPMARGTQHVPYIKTKRRVILVGDSFMYGWEIAKDETIDHFLGEHLGSNFEVINLGTRGYGLDQMLLVVNQVVPQLSPDDVIVGFIASDLQRACRSFWGVAKPRFTLVDGRLVSPRPVPTPYEMYLRHRDRRILDAVLAKLYFVRVWALAIGPFLRGAQETCITKLNAALLRSLMRGDSQKTRIHLIHLDGELPDEFVAELASLKVPYYSAPPDVGATARALGVTPDRWNDGHPKAGLNAIYAYMIDKMLAREPQTSASP